MEHHHNLNNIAMRKAFGKFVFLLCVCSLATIHFTTHAATPVVSQPQVSNPVRVLFVGNSYFYYNNSLHNHVRRMVGAHNAELDKRIQYK